MATGLHRLVYNPLILPPIIHRGSPEKASLGLAESVWPSLVCPRFGSAFYFPSVSDTYVFLSPLGLERSLLFSSVFTWRPRHLE
jgi:hypothetical protein